MDALNYPGGIAADCEKSPCMPRQMSPLEQLRATKSRKESEVKEITEAIAALESVPELDRVLHLLGKAIRY